MTSAAAADNVTVALLEQDPSGTRLSWAFPSAGEMSASVIGARALLR